MMRRSTFIVLARTASAAYFLATALYCLLTYNAFAYQQFIRPHMISALTDFTVWHGMLYWVVLLMTTVTLFWTSSRNPPPRVWIYLAVSAVIGVWLIVGQVLPQTENSSRSLYLALAALVPPIWLAVIDHLGVDVAPTEPSDDRRLLGSALIAAALVWLTYALAAPFRPRPSGAMIIAMRELALGASSSAIAHLTVFVVLVLVAITLRELVVAQGWHPRIEYALLVGASAVAAALVVLRLIFLPIAFRGPAAWTVAAVVGSLVALTWSSVARYRYADAPAPRPTAMDVWLAPIAGRQPWAPIAGLLVLPVAAYVLTTQAALMDWNFMVQQLIALVVWLVAFGLVYAATARSQSRINARARVAVPLAVVALFGVETAAMPRLSSWLHDARLQSDFVLDGYAALDPSYRLLRETLAPDPGADPEFYAFLRAYATIHPTVPVEPADVDFVKPLPAATGDKPHIFFFLIDSLRPDYVGAYNPAATFTPRFDTFAEEPGTHLFRRTFSRYGGTGLSVPAIWAGAMILHKEYVTPFAPMNALEKLLTRNGYQWFLTKDHITDLFTPSPAITWLDEHVTEMEHTFCGTMEELATKLRTRPADAPPIFAHTRPLDLHVSKVRSGIAPAGESYPGFNEAYAGRVRRIDACFGQFVDTLKELGLYDDSVIVISSDHGDSLGEEQRWGHAYTLFPEVMQIPLIVHLPPRLDEYVTADLGRLSVATDITPTLYSLLGYRLSARGPLFGIPLFDVPDADWSHRRSESLFLASSYGAVYGLLSHNGRNLYIVDAINEREYLYEVTRDAVGRRIGITDADRARARKAIHDQVAELAAQYRFTPEP